MFVNDLYTLANVSSLVSTFTWSFGSRYTFNVLAVFLDVKAAASASLYLIRLPTISVGYTISSRIASCTAVNVLLLGRGPFCDVDLLTVFDRIVRCATITTCLPLNFFSSSRTSLVCTL